MADWKYSLDFNEGCPNVAYLLDFLHRVRDATPDGFARILYIEQPTVRDLQRDRANVMHEAARLCPIVVDESLTDLESLLLAREMGYTGVALKACKGQSQALLMAAAAQKHGMFLCVQDLTCPGASLDPLRRPCRPGAGQRRDRGQRPAIRPGGQRPGRHGSRIVHHQRRRHGHRATDRPWPGGGAAGTAADGSLTPASRTPLARSERRAIERRPEKRQIAPRRPDRSLLGDEPPPSADASPVECAGLSRRARTCIP